MSSEQVQSCSDMSRERASRIIKGLGYKSLGEVPVGAGNDYLNTLLLIVRGYSFGGVSFDQAMRMIHDENWKARDILNLQMKKSKDSID